MPDTHLPNRGEFNDIYAVVDKKIDEGLRHGFFEYSISCETGKGNKRHVIFKAGKSYKFTIPKEDLDK